MTCYLSQRACWRFLSEIPNGYGDLPKQTRPGSTLRLDLVVADSPSSALIIFGYSDGNCRLDRQLPYGAHLGACGLALSPRSVHPL